MRYCYNLANWFWHRDELYVERADCEPWWTGGIRAGID